MPCRHLLGPRPPKSMPYRHALGLRPSQFAEEMATCFSMAATSRRTSPVTTEQDFPHPSNISSTQMPTRRTQTSAAVQCRKGVTDDSRLFLSQMTEIVSGKHAPPSARRQARRAASDFHTRDNSRHRPFLSELAERLLSEVQFPPSLLLRRCAGELCREQIRMLSKHVLVKDLHTVTKNDGV